jgi:hypothetical protein
MAMLAKGQVRIVPADDVPAQLAFVHRVFGLAARPRRSDLPTRLPPANEPTHGSAMAAEHFQ